MTTRATAARPTTPLSTVDDLTLTSASISAAYGELDEYELGLFFLEG